MDIANDPAVQAAMERIYAVSDKIARDFLGQFERLRWARSEEVQDPRWGFIDQFAEFNFERAAIKYALHARVHTRTKLRYLRHLTDLGSAFDIGTGPCHMLVLLRDGLGIPVSGCDAWHCEGHYLYQAFRKIFGLEDAVIQHEVKPGHDIPIPAGTDAVLALWPMFEAGWSLADHAWFVDTCRAHGARRIVWRFNNGHLAPRTLHFYRDMGARFPESFDYGFCIVPL